MVEQPHLLPVFFCFTIGTSWGILNVMVGLILASVTEASEQLKKGDHERERKEHQAMVLKVAELMSMMKKDDANSDGKISVTELASLVQTREFKEVMRNVDWPIDMTLDE